MICGDNTPICTRVAHSKPTFSPDIHFLKTSSYRLPKDQLCFGSKPHDLETNTLVPFHQAGDSSISRENPVSGNNCQICSVKNMLSYYGYNPHVIENFMEQTVKPALLANPEGIVPIDDKDELNNLVLREIVSDKSGIKMGRPLQLGCYHGLVNNPDSKTAITNFLNHCATIGDNPTPLLINIGPGVAGAAGRKASEENGHAFFAYPAKNGSGNWHIVDSLETNIRHLTRPEFDDYIFKNTHQTVQIYPVIKGPNPQKMAAFEPLVNQPPANNSTPKLGPSLQSQGKWTQFKQWIKLKWKNLVQGLKKTGQSIKGFFTSRVFKKRQTRQKAGA